MGLRDKVTQRLANVSDRLDDVQRRREKDSDDESSNNEGTGDASGEEGSPTQGDDERSGQGES